MTTDLRILQRFFYATGVPSEFLTPLLHSVHQIGNAADPGTEGVDPLARFILDILRRDPNVAIRLKGYDLAASFMPLHDHGGVPGEATVGAARPVFVHTRAVA